MEKDLKRYKEAIQMILRLCEYSEVVKKHLEKCGLDAQRQLDSGTVWYLKAFGGKKGGYL